MSSLEIRCERSAYRQAVDFYAFDPETKAYAEQFVMESRQPGVEASPSFSLDEMSAQGLMDELWRAGLRPTEGTGSAGALAATARHLEDMRKIALDFVSQSLMDRAVARSKGEV